MIKIKESFSAGLPAWLTKDKDLNRYMSNRGIDLHNATYVPDKMLSSGRDKRLKDSSRLQVFRLDNGWGRDVAYVVGVNNPTIEIGDRWDEARKFPMKSIIQAALEYGYIDLNNPDNSNRDVRRQRADAKRGSIERGKGQYKYNKVRYNKGDDGYTDWDNPIDDGYEWITTKGQDKSGYPLPDPEKYVKMLNSADKSNYGKKLETLYNKILKFREDVSKIDINDKNSDRASSGYQYLSNIISSYRSLLQDCDRRLNRDYNYSERFINHFFSDSKYGFPAKMADINSDIKRYREYLGI